MLPAMAVTEHGSRHVAERNLGRLTDISTNLEDQGLVGVLDGFRTAV